MGETRARHVYNNCWTERTDTVDVLKQFLDIPSSVFRQITLSSVNVMDMTKTKLQ